MANNVANVSAGKPKVGGAIYYCKGTPSTAPTDTSSTLTGFTCLGYVSEDGLTNNNTPESDNTKAWGGDTVLTLQTSKEDTFGFKLLEVLNADVLKLVYGEANVTEASGKITITANNKELDHGAFVFDMVLNSSKVKRIYVPIATPTKIGEIAYKDSEAVGYDITITASPDSSGNTHYEWIE